MTDNLDAQEEDNQTTQQLIREMGELVHADEEINQDNLPVYFRMELPGRYWLVVDMVHKNEIGVDCPKKGYKVVNQIVADLIMEIALAYKQSKNEIHAIDVSGANLPVLGKEPWNERYSITHSPPVHTLLPDEKIPPGTPTLAGDDNETE